MQIKNIKIKNLKSIGGQIQEFEFKNGLHLISGDVGCGKTTVYTAIVYTLFNKNTDFKGNSKSTLPIGKLINDVNKKDMLVEILFDNGYLIKRGQKPDIFEIWKDGINLANKSVTVDQEFLEQTVLEGLTFDIFLSTVYLSNKPGSIPFLHMTQGQRKEYIEKILDLRRVFYYNENLKKYISENKLEKISLEKEKSLLEETITNEEFNIRTQKTKQEQQKQKLKDYQENHSRKLQEQQDKIEALNTKQEQFQEIYNTYQVPQEQKQEIQDNIKTKLQEIQDLEKVDYSKTTQEEINIYQEIQELEKEIEDNSFKRDMIESDLRTDEYILQESQDLLKNKTIEELQDIQEKLNKINTAEINKKAEYEAYMKSKENYHLCAGCPTLPSIIGTFSEDEYESFMKKLQDVKKTYQEKQEKYQKQLEKIQQIEKENQEIQEKKAQAERKLQECIQKIEYQEKEIESKIQRKEQIKKSLKEQNELRKENLKQQIKHLEQEVQNLYENNRQKILQQIEIIKSEIKSTQEYNTLLENETPPEVQEVSEEYLKSLYTKKDALLVKIDDEYNKSVELDELKKEINSPEHKAKAIQKYIPIFQVKLNEIIDKFMEDDTFTLTIKITEEFDLQFYKNGKEISIFSLSSGQVACTSLACTFAFLYLLEVKHQTRFNHLLVDELLDIAIGNRVQYVLQYLKESSADKNISVISHNKSLNMEMFDSVTTVTKGDIFSEYRID